MMTMREILFRAKSKDTGEWLYGDLMNYAGTAQIWHQTDDGKWNAIVIPETIGQYTGLYDATKWEDLSESEQEEWLETHTADEWKGRKIFEGDIIKGKDGRIFSIEWGEGLGQFIARESKTHNLLLGVNKGTMTNYEVIGNIHDNPELLEVNNE